MNGPIIFFDRDNKTKLVPASCSCFFKIFVKNYKVQVAKYSKSISAVKCYNPNNSLYCSKLITMFYLHCSRKKPFKNQVTRIQN